MYRVIVVVFGFSIALFNSISYGQSSEGELKWAKVNSKALGYEATPGYRVCRTRSIKSDKILIGRASNSKCHYTHWGKALVATENFEYLLPPANTMTQIGWSRTKPANMYRSLYTVHADGHEACTPDGKAIGYVADQEKCYYTSLKGKPSKSDKYQFLIYGNKFEFDDSQRTFSNYQEEMSAQTSSLSEPELKFQYDLKWGKAGSGLPGYDATPGNRVCAVLSIKDNTKYVIGRASNGNCFYTHWGKAIIEKVDFYYLLKPEKGELDWVPSYTNFSNANIVSIRSRSDFPACSPDGKMIGYVADQEKCYFTSEGGSPSRTSAYKVLGFTTESVHQSILEENKPRDYLLFTSIKVVEENDGGGNAEEIFGSLYVKSPSKKINIWSTSEDSSVDIPEGKFYNVPGVTILEDLNLDSPLQVGGHLYEEDAGGDDDLKERNKSILVRDMLNKYVVVRFSYEKTKVNVGFRLEKKGQKNASYVTLEKIKLVKPSKGTDTATEAGTGIAIAASSLIGGTALSFISPKIGSYVLVTGLKTAIFSSPEVVELVNKTYEGKDDVYIKVRDKKVWPSDSYIVMKSQQTERIDKTFVGWQLDFELFEYDSGSRDDPLGGFQYDISKQLDSLTAEEEKELNQQIKETGKGTYRWQAMVDSESEKSSYMLWFKLELY